MIVRAKDTKAEDGRKPYPLGGLKVVVKHFVVRITTPSNPFRPHKHEQPELWFIIDGEAVVTVDGQDHVVTAQDLIAIEPWVEHGLRAEQRAEWICLG